MRQVKNESLKDYLILVATRGELLLDFTLFFLRLPLLLLPNPPPPYLPPYLFIVLIPSSFLFLQDGSISFLDRYLHSLGVKQVTDNHLKLLEVWIQYFYTIPIVEKAEAQNMAYWDMVNLIYSQIMRFEIYLKLNLKMAKQNIAYWNMEHLAWKAP